MSKRPIVARSLEFLKFQAPVPGRAYRLAERKGITLDFIEPGRPMQNGFIERFKGSFRRGVLDMHVFRNLSEGLEQSETRIADYNGEIPHDSLGDLTPTEFMQQSDPGASGYGWP